MKPTIPIRGMARLVLLGTLAGSSVTCLFPTGDQAGERVFLYQVALIQRLETLEGYAAVGGDGVRQPTQCDSTTTVPEAAPAITCLWRIDRPDLSATFNVEPAVPFRLGDRVVVRARVGRDGPGGAEVLLRSLSGGQRGPSALRFVADTIDLLSVGEVRIAVYAAGFPEAVPDTLTLFTYPARLPPQCGTQQTPPCALDSLLVGEVIEIPGGPFAVVRDPASGDVLSVLPEPVVTIGGLPATLLERTDTLLRVAVPAGAGSGAAEGNAIQVAMLGVPAACTPSLLDLCYRPRDFSFLDWDLLEPESASSPTELATATGDSTLAWYPSLALEGRATPWALDAAGRAHDWYAFTLDEPTVVQVELSSAVPLDVQLTDTLQWDAVTARSRIVPGGWAVGSRHACQGVELAFAFPDATRGGTKIMTVALATGRYHLAVTSTGPLPSAVGYGLRLTAGGTAPDDDPRCESALPFTGAATGTLTGSFDVDWFATTATDSGYAEVLASSAGETPGIAVLRDRLPDSLPVIAQGEGRSLPLLTPGRHLIAVLGNGRRTPYDLTAAPTTWGPPATLELAGLPSSAAVCEAWDVTVTARDKLGNRVVSYAGTVLFGSTDPAAGLPATYTFTPADSGRHRFVNGVTLQTEGARTVTVTESGTAGLAGNATVTVTPPGLRVAATPATAIIGVGEQASFTTTVTNTCGVPVNSTVTWASVNPARATMTGNTATGLASGQVALRADAGSTPTYVHLTVTAPRPATSITWDSVVGTTLGENLRAVWAAGPNAVWAVGTPGLIMAFDGSGWTTVRRTGVEADTLFGVWGTGPSDVWAVGTGGTVLHFDGASWTPLDAETNRGLRGVWAASPEDVWIVGDASTILRFDGLTFAAVPVTEFPNVDHLMVWGRTPSEVWVGGDESVLRRHDGVTLATLSHRPQGDQTFRAQRIWGVSATNLRYWVACVRDSGGECATQPGSETFAWNGTEILATEQPPLPTGTPEVTWYGQSVLGTDATEFWYLTTQGLVAGAGGSWTTLLSWATSAIWTCSPAPAQIWSGRLTGVAAGFVSLPGDVWIVGTCYQPEGNPNAGFRSLILRGRY